MHPCKLLGAVAIIPFVFGLNLQTGQNFFSIDGLNESGAAILGLIFELLAFGLVTASRHNPSRILIAVLFFIQAPLVAAWGIIVGMFSGLGDGFTRGASLTDILPWFFSGLIYASLGIYTIMSIKKATRSAKGATPSEQDAPSNGGKRPV